MWRFFAALRMTARSGYFVGRATPFDKLEAGGLFALILSCQLLAVSYQLSAGGFAANGGIVTGRDEDCGGKIWNFQIFSL